MRNYTLYEHLWNSLGLLVGLALLMLLIVSVAAPVSVRGYYISAGVGTTCVRANLRWAEDPQGACFSTAEEAVAALERLSK